MNNITYNSCDIIYKITSNHIRKVQKECRKQKLNTDWWEKTCLWVFDACNKTQ